MPQLCLIVPELHLVKFTQTWISKEYFLCSICHTKELGPAGCQDARGYYCNIALLLQSC